MRKLDEPATRKKDKVKTKNRMSTKTVYAFSCLAFVGLLCIGCVSPAAKGKENKTEVSRTETGQTAEETPSKEDLPEYKKEKKPLMNLDTLEDQKALLSNPVLAQLQCIPVTPKTEGFHADDLNSVIPVRSMGEPERFLRNEEIDTVFPNDIRFGLLHAKVEGKEILLYVDKNKDLILDDGKARLLSENQRYYSYYGANKEQMALSAKDEEKQRSEILLYDWKSGELERLTAFSFPETCVGLSFDENKNLYSQMATKTESGELVDPRIVVWNQSDQEWDEVAKLPYRFNDMKVKSHYIAGIRQLTNTQRSEEQTFQIYDMETGEIVDTEIFGSTAFAMIAENQTGALVIAEPDRGIYLYHPMDKELKHLEHNANRVIWRVYPMLEGFVIQTRSNHYFYFAED